MTEKERHLVEYLIFLIFGISLLVCFWLLKENRLVLKILSGLGSLLYILWGIIHHSREDRLSKEVLTEYFLLGGFVFLLLFTALSI